MLRYAVRKGLIDKNPFADLKTRVGSNPERRFFVTPDMGHRVLDACPDAEWRFLFALVRFGRLRYPNEVLAPEWRDVDWEQARFTVRSVMTENHVGKDWRVVPFFPELRPFLDAVWD